MHLSQTRCEIERFRQSFLPRLFPAIFGGHLEFLRKTKQNKKKKIKILKKPQKYTFIYETFHFGINGKNYY